LLVWFYDVKFWGGEKYLRKKRIVGKDWLLAIHIALSCITVARIRDMLLYDYFFNQL